MTGSTVGGDGDTKATALARRRQRTREAMQRLRERKQQAIAQLRATAATLAAEHAALLQTRTQSSQPLEHAMQRAQALVAANARLQNSIDEYVRWEDHVALLAEYLRTECDTMASKIPRPPPLSIPCNFVTAPRLTEARAMELMLFHRKKRKALKKQWLLASRPPFSSDFFGWNIQYFPQGRYWHLKFNKLFRNVRASTVSRRAWGNAKRMVTYRTRIPNQRLVQVINDNAFVFMRWTNGRDHLLKHNQVMYLLRFRIEEPDGTTSICMLTLPEPGESDADALDDKAFPGGDDMCLCIKLKPVKDAVTGEEHCLIEYSGRTQFGDAEHAQLNALEMIISLARWEEVNVTTLPVHLVWS